MDEKLGYLKKHASKIINRYLEILFQRFPDEHISLGASAIRILCRRKLTVLTYVNKLRIV